MTQREVAEYLRMTDRNVRNLIAAGKLTGYKLAGGRTVRLRRDQVEALLEPIPAATA
ncbi:DNA binding, excisionase family domain protein [Mycolicibacterium hassiacum DSM 44199]|uniref:DNA binding, excisionase family domain protein n=2 Tax=Mycolicibacterium hassiacum TaxID=46351 RepID=K5BIP1_MYCHD|nr:DNA binding, excisionase family domain protein [Mycolicibacterium hassiacum DSM 44199]MDA4088298.1 excisionase [Mycolicibacterium hassiacum DSM 44199]